MSLEWDRGLILYVPFRPFGHRAFAFALLGLPGVLLLHEGAAHLSERQLRCLKVHERYHWLQWARWTVPIMALLGLLSGFADLPWWIMLGGPYVWHVAYLAGRRETWEAEADRVKHDCLRGTAR